MKLLLVLVFPVLLAAGIAYVMLALPKLEPIEIPSTGWWAEGERPAGDDDVTIAPIRVSIRDNALADWKRRVEFTRFGVDLENGTFEYGFQVNYMKEVQQHWLKSYDWKKQEEELNKYLHFSTKIEGINIHFMRIQPKKAGSGRVLLMLHGWPGSIWEFVKIIPMLTDPESYGGRAEDAFEVICPSLPGFGFSQPPRKEGFGISAAARVFLELMTRLGHDNFYVQGGDWGAIIATTMAQLYPSHILGLHVNMITLPNKHPGLKLHQMAAWVAPALFLKEEDRENVAAWEDYARLLKETGYLHIQATKPDTVAMGLNDSPVGLAAYILEKFSTWTDPANRDLPDGGLTKSYTLDDLLTNVMIYWFTGTIGSSMRIYKECFRDEIFGKLDNYPVYVPTGLARFPNEIFPVARAFAEYRYKHVLQFTAMPKGGHFAAMEQPRLLADDIFSFVKKVQTFERLGP